ncbi:hypothetical protein [Amycolatopsis anabasis]|uniref:hypothetical protein n=1 Tax=Amycolatopsis anabasis TaxID=1840409 RepID=UPI00131DE908|nr:hypothetical protein [Amycolatopsis anabasis]
MAQDGKNRTIDGAQGVFALIGITVGAIPLVRWMVDGQHGGLFRWLFGTHSGSMGYVLPIVVIVVAIAFIGALEIVKKRRA